MKHRPLIVIFTVIIAVIAAQLPAVVLAHTSTTIACKWGVISSPNLGTTDNQLQGVAAISANDVWAVDNVSPNSTTLHWNGALWSIVTPASPTGSTGITLLGIKATSTSDVWAVGSYYTQSGALQTLIEHWNGASWSVVASPNATTQNWLAAISATAANNAWAVGTAFDVSYNSTTLVEHWNGSAWSIVSSPNPSSVSNQLSSVKAISASNVWAVGNSFVNTNFSPTLIEHWDGQSWSIVSSPFVASKTNYLFGVATVSATNIWAVGYSVDPFQVSQTLIEHWNGTLWSIVSSPNGTGSSSNLRAIAVVSGKNIWAVGDATDLNGDNTLVEHWNGTQWSIVTSPNPLQQSNILQAVARVPGTGQVWAVGYASSQVTDQTLTEFRC